MTTNARRSISRYVRWTLLVHTAFVLIVVVAKNALWGTAAPSWGIERVFRLIELPVTWAVDRLLQVLPVLPPWAAFGRLWVATSVSEVILYGVLGGAFYAVVAAAVAFARERRGNTTSVEASS